MKGHRSVGLGAGPAAGLVLFLGLWAGASAFAETPLLILGLTGGGYLSSEEGSSPAFFPESRVSALSSWRGTLAGGGIVSLNASSRLFGYWDAGAIFHDRENLAVEALLPLGSFAALLAAGLDGSALGTVEAPPYAQPGWSLGLRTTGEPWRAELRLNGHYLYRPQDVQDALYQAARLNLTFDPSIRWGLASALEAGWEYWPEYQMPGVERRQDALLRVETGFEGLAGYFLDWSLLGYGGLRLSNVELAGEESTWFAAGEGNLSWSPHRRLGLQLGGFALYESWLERQALTSGGTPSGETLYVLSLGLDGRIDWTPNGKLFLVVEGTAARRLANDPAEERWSLSAGLGMEYSF
jgi:hypothetical protein